MRRKFWRIPAALVAALGIAACQSPPRIDVEQQWADAMSNLNMFGFYPPTEDIQVGDIFLYAPQSGSRSNVPRFSLMRVASLHPARVLHELQGQQGRQGQTSARGIEDGDRLTIMPLPDRKRNETTTGAVSRTANCDGYDIGHADESGCRVRMQRATMPGFAAGRVTNGQLGAAGIFGNFGANLGLSGSSEVAVNLAFRNLQELQLDAWRVSRLQEDHWSSALRLMRTRRLMEALRELRGDLLRAACNGDTRTMQRNRVEFMVLNRVIYAGGIEYSFARNAETAIRLAVDLQSTLPGQPQAPQTPTLPNAQRVIGNTAIGTDNAGREAAQTAAAARLAGVLQGITGYTGSESRAGISTSFGIGTFGNLTLREDFNRLMAVGAGSRMRFPFHTVLAGDAEFRRIRFDDALAYCEGTFPDGFDVEGLRRAMRVSAN